MTVSHPTGSEPFPTRRKATILGGILISFATIFIILVGIELAGYLWERKTAQESLGWTLVASRRMPLVRHGTQEKPYYLFEPIKDYNWEGVPVRISSQGFRGDEFAQEKPTDTYRIVNLGDSVVFGWEVRYEETYGKQLEMMLDAVGDGFDYEVINAGIPGWNLPMAHRFLVQEGLSYDPDMVLLGITVVNDVYGAGPAVSENPSLFDWLRDNTFGWPFLTTQARFLLAQQRGPEAIPVLNPPQEERAYYPLDEDHPAWKRFWDAILAMQSLTQERGIKFALIVFPTAYQLNSAGHSDFPQRLIKERAGSTGINVVDLLPVYRKLCSEADIGACEGYENLLFADVWMHPNVLGHQVAANELFESRP
jgi:hypothetical protein